MNFPGVAKPLLLVFPFDVMAHYLRCINVAKYLQPYFTIKFQYSAKYQTFIEHSGFETFHCKSLNADQVQTKVRAFNFSWLNEQDLRDIYEDQVAVITSSNASVVLGDMAPTLKMAAEKTGVWYFSLSNAYMSRYYASMRKMPSSYPFSRLFKLLPEKTLNNMIVKGEDLFFRRLHKPFSTIRRSEQLWSKQSYHDELEGDINLLCDLPRVFPQAGLPLNYVFIPPLFYDLTNKDDELVHLLDPCKKTLLVSMGSTGQWKSVSFLNNAWFSKFNIITAGDVGGVLKGKHVIARKFVDSKKLFTNVDLVICHGGNGTVYQALNFGIPVLCFTAHLEQEYNVDGMQKAGVGKSINSLSMNEIKQVVDEFLAFKNAPALLRIKEEIASARCNAQQVIDQVLSLLAPSIQNRDMELQQTDMPDLRKVV